MTLTRRRGKHCAPRPSRRPASAVSGLVAAVGLALTLAACGDSGSGLPDDDAVAAAVEDAVGTSEEDVDAALQELGEAMAGGKPEKPDEPLTVGDCVETIWWETPAAELPSIDCDEVHDAEVYLAVPLDSLGPAFPGRSAIMDEADRPCTDGFEEFVGIPEDQSVNMFQVLEPTEESWADGDRTALCYAMSRTFGEETGSLEGVAE